MQQWKLLLCFRDFVKFLGESVAIEGFKIEQLLPMEEEGGTGRLSLEKKEENYEMKGQGSRSSDKEDGCKNVLDVGVKRRCRKEKGPDDSIAGAKKREKKGHVPHEAQASEGSQGVEYVRKLRRR